jgi:ATP-dependent Clp protease, protease subunit
MGQSLTARQPEGSIMKKIMQLYRDNKDRKVSPVNLVRNENEATIYVYDLIDSYWGVSATSFIEAMNQAGDAAVLNIRISSPGGDVFESRAIMAAIQRFSGKTVAHIDGLAASAATSIALACNEVVMSDGAFFMIHNASGFAYGDKQAMRDSADLLEKVESVIITDYTKKTGKPTDQVIAWMDSETWFTASEALDNGFVDRIAEAKAAGNTWNLSAFNKTPDALKAPPIERAPPVAPPEKIDNKHRERQQQRLKLANHATRQ